MKKVVIEVYDSLEDEFNFVETNKDDFSSIGFCIELDSLDKVFVEKETNKGKDLLIKMINKLKKEKKINKIYHAGIHPLAKISPIIRVMFLCYCNKYDSNSDLEGLLEGELPKTVEFDYIEKFLKTIN